MTGGVLRQCYPSCPFPVGFGLLDSRRRGNDGWRITPVLPVLPFPVGFGLLDSRRRGNDGGRIAPVLPAGGPIAPIPWAAPGAGPDPARCVAGGGTVGGAFLRYGEGARRGMSWDDRGVQAVRVNDNSWHRSTTQQPDWLPNCSGHHIAPGTKPDRAGYWTGYHIAPGTRAPTQSPAGGGGRKKTSID